MIAVPREALARIHASSGTTGKPTVVAYTAADLELFGRVNARSLAMAGVEPGMTLHNAYGYGLFTGGLGLHAGGEHLGANVVPVSAGMTERQLTLVEDMRPTRSRTSRLRAHVASAFAERGLSPGDLGRFAVVGAEPWSERMRAEIDASSACARRTSTPWRSSDRAPARRAEGARVRTSASYFLRGRRPAIGTASAGRRGRRSRLHDADEGGAAAAALPHGRPRLAHARAVRLRPDVRADVPRPRPDRRHADHPRRQRLSERGRAGAPRDPGASPHFDFRVRRDGTLDSVEVVVEPNLRHACDAGSVVARRQRSSARRSAAP